jgi:glycogen(starch) synthase
MKILYLAGPGNVIDTYRHWTNGQDDPNQTAVTYSGQFYDLCKENCITAKVISYNNHKNRLVDGQFDIEHRPVRFASWRGPFFHLAWYWFSFTVALSAIWCRSDVLVLMTGTHLTPYWIARLFGAKVILTQQCVIWPKNRPRSFSWKFVHRMDRPFMKSGCEAIVLNSVDIERQVHELCGDVHAPIRYFCPHYRRDTFSDLGDASIAEKPFRVLFAGRVEPEKGALCLVEIAEILRSSTMTPFLIEVAGDGSVLSELERRITSAGLGNIVKTYGYCPQDKMRQLLKTCHAVIVPTTSEMIEGFNKVVAEAVLAHRPFITSHLSGALDLTRNAGVEVPPDDVRAYAEAIRMLAENPRIYDNCVTASRQLSEQFLDPARSWKSALERVFSEIGVTVP